MWQCNQHEYWISEVIVEYDLQKSNSLVEQVHRLLVRITLNVHYTYTNNTAHFSPIVIAMSCIQVSRSYLKQHCVALNKHSMSYT